VKAQLALADRSLFPRETRPTEVKERCTETGWGKGVLAKQGLCRVSPFWRHCMRADLAPKFQFKLKARQGWQGWQKASW
jgi:small subunit ribosomal protein S14